MAGVAGVVEAERAVFQFDHAALRVADFELGVLHEEDLFLALDFLAVGPTTITFLSVLVSAAPALTSSPHDTTLSTALPVLSCQSLRAFRVARRNHLAGGGVDGVTLSPSTVTLIEVGFLSSVLVAAFAVAAGRPARPALISASRAWSFPPVAQAGRRRTPVWIGPEPGPAGRGGQRASVQQIDKGRSMNLGKRTTFGYRIRF